MESEILQEIQTLSSLYEAGFTISAVLLGVISMWFTMYVVLKWRNN